MVHFYLLIVNLEDQINIYKFEKMLYNSSESWEQIMPYVFIIKTTTSITECYYKIKEITENNMFFLTDILLDKNYTGWLPSSAWDWIKQNR
jgi:presenilin-like A22 family membrane protease